MFENLIKIFFLFITAIYAFYKLLNCKPKNKLVQTSLLLFSILLDIFTTYLFDNYRTIIPFILFFVFFLLMKFTEKQRFLPTSLTALFSFSFSFIVSFFSIILISVLLIPFYCKNYNIPWPVLHIFIGLLQFLLIYFCFRIPRLRKGMNFLYNMQSGNTGSTLCVLIIMLTIMANQLKSRTDFFRLIFFSSILIFGFLLLYWWDYHITQTYRKFLRRNELDSLNLLLEERNQQIITLKDENDYLAELIHKDNKMIPSITQAILESCENKTPLDLSQWETASPLYQKLKQMYDERVEALETHEEKIHDFPHTRFDTVNASLSYMKSEALKAGIPFQVVLFDTLESTISQEISEDDFNHMLSDLLANAIHACGNVPSASIQVYLGKMEEISTIKICNMGNVFHPETLNYLGFSRHTTHADTGGSGIGLMSIWRLKQKYKATLLIEDTIDTDTASASTCMNILFNRKNHYMIQSNRHKELATYINRPDVIIISKD